MDKVSKISKIIVFFEEIFVIDELYLSERRQIFYLLNKLENDEVNKLSIKLEKFEKKLDSLRIEVRSIEKMIGYKGDFREEHSLYEIEGKVRLYILDTLLPKYGFKGIKEDF